MLVCGLIVVILILLIWSRNLEHFTGAPAQYTQAPFVRHDMWPHNYITPDVPTSVHSVYSGTPAYCDDAEVPPTAPPKNQYNYQLDQMRPLYMASDIDSLLEEQSQAVRHSLESTIAVHRMSDDPDGVDWTNDWGVDPESVIDEQLPYRWNLPSQPPSLYTVPNDGGDYITEDGVKLSRRPAPVLFVPDEDPYVG